MAVSSSSTRRPASPNDTALVVVGSHVGLTSRQVAKAQERGGLIEAELDVPTLIDPERRDAHVADIARRVVEDCATSDVLLFTSRTLLRGGDADDSLAISRNVSTAVIEVVQAALSAHQSWVVAKGGITSHDVAGPRARHPPGRGRGSVAAGHGVGVPTHPGDRGSGWHAYVAFAGNVGNDDTLADSHRPVRRRR